MDRLPRLVPHDWPWALRCGIESVLFIWLLVVIPTVSVYLATSSLDAAAALSLSTAVSTGTGLWTVGFGGVLRTAGDSGAVLGLPLLGLTAIQAWWTWSCVGRAKLESVLSALWVGLCSAVVTALLAVFAPAESRTWTAILVLAVLNAAVAFARILHDGIRWEVLDHLRERAPHWLSEARALLRLSLTALLGLSVLIVIFAGVSAAGRISHLHDSLAAGNLLAVSGLVLLQLGWLPTTVIWALSWLIGPGFAVGADSSFAPSEVIPGAVPALPLLGGLPTSALSTGSAFIPLVPVLVGLAVTWYRRETLRELSIRHAVYSVLSASAVSALAALLLCLMASGPIGPGRMESVGPQSFFVFLLLLFELTAGLLLGTLLLHPWVRQQVGIGVETVSERTETLLHHDAHSASTPDSPAEETAQAEDSSVSETVEVEPPSEPDAKTAELDLG